MNNAMFKVQILISVDQLKQMIPQNTVGRQGGVRNLKGQNMIMAFFGPIGLINT